MTDPYDTVWTFDDINRMRTSTNKITTDVTTWGYSGTKHAPTSLTGATTGTYTYNQAGGMATRNGDTLTYDAQQRLTNYDTSGVDDEYVYTTTNQRLLREHGTTVTLYLAGMEVTWDGTTTTVTRYPTLAGTTVATHTTVIGGGTPTVTWNCGNMQNTTVCQAPTATNTTPAVPARKRYTPYGDQRGTTTFTNTDHGFLGQPEDTTGLTYLNNRYHDPQLATFTSVDPLVSKTGTPYLYGNGAPSTLVDPTGLFAFECGPNGEGCSNEEFATAQAGAKAREYIESVKENPQPLQTQLSWCIKNRRACEVWYSDLEQRSSTDPYFLLLLGAMLTLMDEAEANTADPEIEDPPFWMVGDELHGPNGIPLDVKVEVLESGELSISLQEATESGFVGVKGEACFIVCISIGLLFDHGNQTTHGIFTFSGLGIGASGGVVAGPGPACGQEGAGLGFSAGSVLVVGYSVSTDGFSGDWDSFNFSEGSAIFIGLGAQTRYSTPVIGWSHTWMAGC